MRDDELTALIEYALGPEPRAIREATEAGTDVAGLHEEIFAVAFRYQNNSRLLTSDHRAMLLDDVRDLDAILPQLPSDARDDLMRARAVAAYLLAHR